MQRRVLRVAFAAILLAGLSGCVQETVNGTTHIYSHELWVPLGTLFGGIAAILVGWFLRERSQRYGWGLLIFGPICVIFIAPTVLRDRATVDENGFTLRSGIWGMTAVYDVKFADLQQVNLISEESVGRRGAKRINYFLLCERRNGTSAKVPADNKMIKAAAPYLMEKFAERKIPVVDKT